MPLHFSHVDKAKSHNAKNPRQCRGGGVVIALASRSCSEKQEGLEMEEDK